jgi:YhcH/YjgK/YiaL family protein
MVIAKLADIKRQIPITPNFEKALMFLLKVKDEPFIEGKIILQDKLVYAIMSSYITKSIKDQIELEGHKKYIDIHYILEGKELMGWAPAEDVPIINNYDENQDFWNGQIPIKDISIFRIAEGQVAIFYPEDAHASQLTDDQNFYVKKVVMKVHIE